MAGYLIANIDVKVPETFEEYRQKVLPLIKKFGALSHPRWRDGRHRTSHAAATSMRLRLPCG